MASSPFGPYMSSSFRTASAARVDMALGAAVMRRAVTVRITSVIRVVIAGLSATLSRGTCTLAAQATEDLSIGLLTPLTFPRTHVFEKT